MIGTQGIDQHVSACSSRWSQRRAEPHPLPPQITARSHLPAGVSERRSTGSYLSPLRRARTIPPALIMMDFKWKCKEEVGRGPRPAGTLAAFRLPPAAAQWWLYLPRVLVKIHKNFHLPGSKTCLYVVSTLPRIKHYLRMTTHFIESWNH